MKIIIYTLMILCFPFYGFSQNQGGANLVDVNANWTGRACRGTNGLCNIEVSTSSASNGLLENHDNETLSLSINRQMITPEDESNLVSVRLAPNSEESEFIFIMEDDYELESQTIISLNLPAGSHTIDQGEYPVEITNDFIIIWFKI
jgi:hypothetical protein